jgi:hypothetical protein
MLGAAINAADFHDRTALMYAAESGNADTVERLIMLGADVNKQDDYGETALIKAVLKGHPDVVELLRGLGAISSGTLLGLDDVPNDVAKKLTSVEVLRLHEGRLGMATIVDGELIYVIGGAGDQGPPRSIEVFNPLEMTSGTLYIAIGSRWFHSAILKDGVVYIIGGYGESESKVEIIDLKAGELRQAAPLPTPRVRAATVLVGDDIYVIGGYLDRDADSRGWTSAVEVFNTVSNVWRTVPSMPTARECPAVYANGMIYTLGGFAGGGAGLRVVEVFDPVSMKWTRMQDIPFALSAHSAIALGNTIVTFGDYRKLDRVAALDIQSGEWRELEIGYQPSRHNSCIRLGDEVFVIGGNVAASAGSYLNRIQRFPVSRLLATEE